MNKSFSKLLQNILCSIISVVLIFGLLLGVANAEPIQVQDPFQKVILQTLDLSQEQRQLFIQEVLEKITVNNYSSYISTVKGILGLSITDADIGIVLKTYAEYPDNNKTALNTLITYFNLPKEYKGSTSEFPDIVKRINTDFTGDPYDDRGIKLFVEAFKVIRIFNHYQPVFFNGSSDPYMIDIRIDGLNTFKSVLDILIKSIESFEKMGINNFEEYVAYIENEVNTNSYNEIYNFKKFLKGELGNSSVEEDIPDASNIDPLQKILLKIVSLPKGQRADFVDNILSKLTATNYNDYLYAAKRILGVSISDSDMTKGLKAYGEYPAYHKESLNMLIAVYQLPSGYQGMGGFPDIEKRINFEVAGSTSDSRGFKMFVELFKVLSTFNGNQAMFYNGEDDKYKIDIKVKGLNNLKSEFDTLVLSIESLNKRGINSFDSFVDYVENTINTNSYAEIYNLKKFLKGEVGNGSYTDVIPNPSEIDPFQKVMLELMGKPEQVRADFVDDILSNLTQSNCNDYLYSAKRILGVSMSDSDMLNALVTYAKYPNVHKDTFNNYIKTFGLPSGLYAGIDTFPSIRNSINAEIAGDESDDRGLKIFVELFRALKEPPAGCLADPLPAGL